MTHISSFLHITSNSINFFNIASIQHPKNFKKSERKEMKRKKKKNPEHEDGWNWRLIIHESFISMHRLTHVDNGGQQIVGLEKKRETQTFDNNQRSHHVPKHGEKKKVSRKKERLLKEAKRSGFHPGSPSTLFFFLIPSYFIYAYQK